MLASQRMTCSLCRLLITTAWGPCHTRPFAVQWEFAVSTAADKPCEGHGLSTKKQGCDSKKWQQRQRDTAPNRHPHVYTQWQRKLFELQMQIKSRANVSSGSGLDNVDYSFTVFIFRSCLNLQLQYDLCLWTVSCKHNDMSQWDREDLVANLAHAVSTSTRITQYLYLSLQNVKRTWRQSFTAKLY